MAGKNLLNGKLIQGNNNIDISLLQSGFYLMKTRNESGYAETHKFVKE